MARRIALGAVLGVLLMAVPAGATVVPELGAVTTLTSDGSGWTPVQLKHAVRIDLFAEEGPRASIKATGPVQGFLLRHDGDAKSEPGLLGFSWFGLSIAFIVPSYDVPEANFAGEHLYVDLPAGAYRLYLFGGGRLVLKLPGLGPDVTLDADQPAAFKAVDTPRLDPFVLGNLSVFGTAAELQTKGLIYTNIDLFTELDAVDRTEACIYPPGSDFSGADAFSPGCPGSPAASNPLDPNSMWVVVPPGAGGSGYAAWNADAEPGRYGLGANATDVAAPADVGAQAAWMSYGPSGLPPGYELNPPAPPAKKAVKKHKAKRKCTAKRKRAHKCGAKRKHKH
jgi:hypothetical protein